MIVLCVYFPANRVCQNKGVWRAYMIFANSADAFGGFRNGGHWACQNSPRLVQLMMLGNNLLKMMAHVFNSSLAISAG